ncbi:hypothetical protein V6B33_18520 [Mangrovibacillus sp. Mu-81]|jgi:hypothetical protein|uniref:hypothetical protein n=1 Tax=Mangrovibacillus sp. Mu-81 TaxID=3121478 RepID=UPI002FE4B807
MKKKLVATVIITCSFLVTAVIANNKAFNHAKNSCVENHKMPIAKKSLLAFKWSVSCH